MINVLIIGAGAMAKEYAKSLNAQGHAFHIHSRTEKNAKELSENCGVSYSYGHLPSLLSTYTHAVIAIPVSMQLDYVKELSKKGVRKILVEKPGGFCLDEIRTAAEVSSENMTKVFVAYNRRFYNSTLKALEIIREDGGVKSFSFDFTEWSHRIVDSDIEELTKRNWFISNSTHVIDLAFFLGGKASNISCYTAGKSDWHDDSVIYSGAGVSENNALFNYHANWESSGRWNVEVNTSKRKIILCPLEGLKHVIKGKVIIEDIEISSENEDFIKHGIYNQINSFINGDYDSLCSLEDMLFNFEIYNKIRGL